MADDKSREFDWIDDAFDDKRTAEDIEMAKGPMGATLLLALTLIASAALIIFTIVLISTL